MAWSHYKILLTIKDEEKRKEIEQIVTNNDLSKRELWEMVIRYKKDIGNRKIPKLLEKRGFPYYFKLKQITGDKNTHGKLYAEPAPDWNSTKSRTDS